MNSPTPTFGDALVLRVVIRDVEPPVWRSIVMPAELSLGALHFVLQAAFGWKDCHLHEVRVGELHFAPPSDEDELLTIDEDAAPLGAVARTRSTLVYVYDFGDSWTHDVTVERVIEGGGDGASPIKCIGGARACPPEDCGGPPGYERLLAALADPADEEHQSMRTWVGRAFDPEKFDAATVNKKLATLSKRLQKTRR